MEAQKIYPYKDRYWSLSDLVKLPECNLTWQQLDYRLRVKCLTVKEAFVWKANKKTKTLKKHIETKPRLSTKAVKKRRRQQRHSAPAKDHEHTAQSARHQWLLDARRPGSSSTISTN